MEVEQLTPDLPQDLIEKVISMMPFPSIFKARLLSKSWSARLSSIESQDNEWEKDLAASFQQLVGEQSDRWDIFCPVSLSEQNSCAYDQASNHWREILSLSFLPKHLQTSAYTHMQGALVFMCAKPRLMEDELIVANILTRNWKVLPPRPNARERPLLSAKVVIPPSSENYSVVVFSVDNSFPDVCSAEIYDSKSDAWSSKILLQGLETIRPTVSLDGVLYMLGNLNHLFAFHVEERTVKDLDIAMDLNTMYSCTVNLVVCNGRLLMVAKELDGPYLPTSYRLLEMDLGRRTLSEVGRGPPNSLEVGAINTQQTSHGDYIYFGVEQRFSRVLAYNVREDKWSYVPCALSVGAVYIPSCFQPGLNPFVAV